MTTSNGSLFSNYQASRRPHVAMKIVTSRDSLDHRWNLKWTAYQHLGERTRKVKVVAQAFSPESNLKKRDWNHGTNVGKVWGYWKNNRNANIGKPETLDALLELTPQVQHPIQWSHEEPVLSKRSIVVWKFPVAAALPESFSNTT